MNVMHRENQTVCCELMKAHVVEDKRKSEHHQELELSWVPGEEPIRNGDPRACSRALAQASALFWLQQFLCELPTGIYSHFFPPVTYFTLHKRVKRTQKKLSLNSVEAPVGIQGRITYIPCIHSGWFCWTLDP